MGKDDDFWAIHSGLTLQLLYRLVPFFVSGRGIIFGDFSAALSKVNNDTFIIAQKSEESPRFWIT